MERLRPSGEKGKMRHRCENINGDSRINTRGGVTGLCYDDIGGSVIRRHRMQRSMPLVFSLVYGQKQQIRPRRRRDKTDSVADDSGVSLWRLLIWILRIKSDCDIWLTISSLNVLLMEYGAFAKRPMGFPYMPWFMYKQQKKKICAFGVLDHDGSPAANYN